MLIGKRHRIGDKAFQKPAALASVTWYVTDENGDPTDLAEITQDGLLTALGEGTVRVTVVTNDPAHCEDSVLLEIQDPYLRLPPGTPFSFKIVVGEQMTIPLDTNIPPEDIEYICTTGFISIDPYGVVTGIKTGMSVIVVRYNDVMINLMITVV